jgi:heptosyltransferase-2
MNGPVAIAKLPPAPQILVRGVNWLGDAVMTTPALLRLRKKFPDAHITMLCPEKLKDLWLHHPAVDAVIPFTQGDSVWKVARKLRAGPETLRTSEAKSHAGAAQITTLFDTALVLPNSPRSALEVFLAGIPQRIGYARPWRNFFLTKTVAPRPDAVKMRKRTHQEIQRLVAGTDFQIGNRKSGIGNALAHQTHEYLHLVAALGANPEPLAPQLAVTTEEIEAARKKFDLSNISQPIFGLNPGAEYGPAKRWPAEKFIAAAREIQQRTNCIWLIFGGKGDLELAGRLAAEIRNPKSEIRNCCGQTSLRELMALMKLCRVLLTNDTGPMHVAAALGTPVVVPFGSTSPELTGPGRPGDPRHRLLKSAAPCSPCFLRECPIDFRCMNGLAVERVVEAVLSTLEPA